MSELKVDAVTAKSTDTVLALKGNGTGVVEIGDGSLKFPDADGSADAFIKTNGSGQLSFATPASGFTLGTPADTSSGTAHTFSGIPSGTSMIIVNFEGVSMSGTVDIIITLGDAGGLETSEYVSTSQRFTSGAAGEVRAGTGGFVVARTSAAYLHSGSVMLTLLNASTFNWAQTGQVLATTAINYISAGEKTLTAELTQISISGGTFDAGAINIMYQ